LFRLCLLILGWQKTGMEVVIWGVYFFSIFPLLLSVQLSYLLSSERDGHCSWDMYHLGIICGWVLASLTGLEYFKIELKNALKLPNYEFVTVALNFSIKNSLSLSLSLYIYIYICVCVCVCVCVCMDIAISLWFFFSLIFFLVMCNSTEQFCTVWMPIICNLYLLFTTQDLRSPLKYFIFCLDWLKIIP